MRQGFLGLLGLLLLACAAPAVAQSRYYDLERWTDSAAAILPAKPQSWRGVFAAGAAGAPTYLGSDQYEAKALGIAEVEYRNTVFASTRKGIGAYVFKDGRFRAGVRATADFGRDSADDDFLTGLPDVDPGLELGLLAEFYTGSFRVRGDIRQEVAGGHGGALFNIEAAYGGRWSKNASLILGMNGTLMSDGYAESYFSVDKADAKPGRPAFAAGLGVRDVGVFAQLIYDVTRDVFVSADLRGNLLLMDAADSPLSVNDPQFFGGVMVGYRF
ncbi:MAG: MipA/OmpV family protein [Alphaproteobacteria bacterium]